jgi:hypothetical protein
MAGTAAQGTDMNSQVNAIARVCSHLADGSPGLRIGAVATVLFGIFGITAVLAWVPGSSAMKEAPPLVETAASQADAISEASLPSGRCTECGIVESAREIWTAGEADDAADAGVMSRTAHGRTQDHLVRRYVLTVRMKDGARRQTIQPTSANWQPGERVILIRGRTDD